MNDIRKKPIGAKGLDMEEALRAYFLRAGYYALRSVQLRYEGFDVTDVDIWLYERPSSVSRHRIIVDAKNRKTPQAIERIFWTKGLQLTLGVEQSIVATTDKRQAVADFGRQHDILVLDGAFIARLVANMGSEAQARLTEEEFRALLEANKLAKGAAAWRPRLEAAKSVVLNGLGYNGINLWLDEARYFAEQAITLHAHAETAVRALYLVISLVALAIDFVLKDLAFAESKDKLAAINEGIRYGAGGQQETQRALDLATGLVERYVAGGRATAGRIRQQLNNELSSLPTDILAEYFGRTNTAQSMFGVARELEKAAYSRRFVAPSNLGPEALGLLGVLSDYWGIDRVRIIGASVLATNSSEKSKSGHKQIGDATQDETPATSDDNPKLLL